MDKKFLICGSSIVVVVLVLASLSPVVGYNSIKSSVKDSPLFRIRTSRAIDTEQKYLTSNYLGKDKEINIPISSRNNTISMVYGAIERISKMGDNDFNRFITSFLNHLHKFNNIAIDNMDINKVLFAIHELRTNPNDAKHNFFNRNWTVNGEDCTIDNWYPGCWPREVINLLLLSSVLIFFFVFIFVPLVIATMIYDFLSLQPTCDFYCSIEIAPCMK